MMHSSELLNMKFEVRVDETEDVRKFTVLDSAASSSVSASAGRSRNWSVRGTGHHDAISIEDDSKSVHFSREGLDEHEIEARDGMEEEGEWRDPNQRQLATKQLEENEAVQFSSNHAREAIEGPRDELTLRHARKMDEDIEEIQVERIEDESRVL
jgi:hypothetical protein